jgi:hypothetical protein
VSGKPWFSNIINKQFNDLTWGRRVSGDVNSDNRARTHENTRSNASRALKLQGDAPVMQGNISPFLDFKADDIAVYTATMASYVGRVLGAEIVEYLEDRDMPVPEQVRVEIRESPKISHRNSFVADFCASDRSLLG